MRTVTPSLAIFLWIWFVQSPVFSMTVPNSTNHSFCRALHIPTGHTPRTWYHPITRLPIDRFCTILRTVTVHCVTSCRFYQRRHLFLRKPLRTSNTMTQRIINFYGFFPYHTSFHYHSSSWNLLYHHFSCRFIAFQSSNVPDYGAYVSCKYFQHYCLRGNIVFSTPTSSTARACVVLPAVTFRCSLTTLYSATHRYKTNYLNVFLKSDSLLLLRYVSLSPHSILFMYMFCHNFISHIHSVSVF